MDLKGKVAVVTGGADGLGYAIVKQLVEEGSFVHIITRNPEKHKNNISLLEKSKVQAHRCDVTDYDKLKQIADSIGKVDVLINNAGVWIEGVLGDNDTEKISDTIDINVKGVIYSTKAFLKGMLEHNSGFVLNISSTSGIMPKPKSSVYCASKWAVRGFTEATKEDLRDTGIKVAGFYPGGMRSSFFEKAGFPKDTGSYMDIEKVAKVITFMLKLDDTMVLDHVVLNRSK